MTEKNVLVISSSPRANGNSGLLCHEFARSAREAGAQVEEAALRALDIAPCKACYGCWTTHRCVLHDDMAALLEKIAAADVLCVATPVYFGLLSGQLKVMIDRLLPLWQGLGGKDVYLIVTGHDGRGGLERTADDLRFVFESLGNDVRGIVWGERVWQKGEVRGTPAMDQACALGTAAAR
jgi:multimeric flavodoxin WrbA